MEDIQIMKERYPDSERVDEDFKWYSDIYDRLEEEFHSDEFIFSLGFMIFTARN